MFKSFELRLYIHDGVKVSSIGHIDFQIAKSAMGCFIFLSQE